MTAKAAATGAKEMALKAGDDATLNAIREALAKSASSFESQKLFDDENTSVAPILAK